MSNLTEQISDLYRRSASHEARLTGLSPDPNLFAATGERVSYGCKVTQGISAADRIVTLDGQAPGDTAHLNPHRSASPSYPFEYVNIAFTRTGGFFFGNMDTTVAPPPGAGLGRYDVAYIFLGPAGPGFGVATGTPSAAIRTDYITNGLRTTPYNKATDVAIPIGTFPVARIYCESIFAGVANAQIADIRDFSGTLKGGDGAPGPEGPPGRDTVYIAYASDDSGTGFTTTFNPALNYIAVKTSEIELDPPVAGDFAGLWFNYKGETGEDGPQGDNGYVYIAYASDDSGTGFTTTFNPALDYIAILSTYTELTPPVAGDFAGLWKKYKGETGLTGPQGDGLEIDAIGTFIGRDAYDAEPEGFVYLSTDGDGDTLTGTTLFVKNSNTSGDWSAGAAFEGAEGPPGEAAFVYIAYATDGSGTGFTTTFNPALDYIAILGTDTEISTPVAGDFAGLWKNYKGQQGPQGDPGVGHDLTLGTGVAAALEQNTTGTGGLVRAASPTVSGPTINGGYTEQVFAVTGTTPALSPNNGSVQTWTLSANSTPTAGTWAAGQSITLMIDDGSARTINWGTLAPVWKTDGGAAPTLNTTGYTVIVLWKVGATIFGARVGDA